ncbi:MAG TPA: alpha/beta hydrolase [Sedimenticola sp.]|nr:alpha/beta hydrolase [Sedimenticola sp.]
MAFIEPQRMAGSNRCHRRGGKWRRFLCTAVAALLVQACAGPAGRSDRLALQLGYERGMLSGEGFQHVVYRKGVPSPGSPLHVYVEGDGTPWIRKNLVSPDPTPDDPLMLRLMAMDGAPSLYLGRPCYFGLAQTPPCNPSHWTDGRYSEKVVASMAAALGGYLQRHDVRRLVLFGHSGGGVLAMLLAGRFAQTMMVVTLGANLDVRAWAAHHGYSALEGSLNPADGPPLPERIRQIHYVGAGDERVPPALVRAAVAGRGHARVVVVEGLDHRCCWDRYWPVVLRAVRDEMER